MNEIEMGTIVVLKENGFGFLKPTNESRQVFFHVSSLVGVRFDELKVGDDVTFVRGEDGDGRPKAAVVRRVA